MGLVKWIAMLTCGHVVANTTTFDYCPYPGMPYWCPEEGCHSTTVVDCVSDLAERDSQGKL